MTTLTLYELCCLPYKEVLRTLRLLGYEGVADPTHDQALLATLYYATHQLTEAEWALTRPNFVVEMAVYPNLLTGLSTLLQPFYRKWALFYAYQRWIMEVCPHQGSRITMYLDIPKVGGLAHLLALITEVIGPTGDLDKPEHYWLCLLSCDTILVGEMDDFVGVGYINPHEVIDTLLEQDLSGLPAVIRPFYSHCIDELSACFPKYTSTRHLPSRQQVVGQVCTDLITS